MYKKRIEKRHLLSKWSYIVALVCCCFYFRLLVRFQFFFFSFLTLYHTFFIACPSKKILYYSKANGFCYMVFFFLSFIENAEPKITILNDIFEAFRLGHHKKAILSYFFSTLLLSLVWFFFSIWKLI